MSEIQEMQDDEREALISIYEGDTAFKQINPTTYSYKYGEDEDRKSLLLELCWGDQYPNEIPTINLDMFYNRNIIASVKAKIIEILNEEAAQWLGCGMTYTLFECLKEKFVDLLGEQPDEVPSDPTIVSAIETIKLGDDTPAANVKVKKEHLTKSQKRRQWEQSDHKGERPRGYNWVDIVKHLSQTGGKEEGGTLPQNYDG
ncbi:RWD domain-containing protein 4 [Bradysia coprophila]|uniref:RWD domain-containing protein 4 n=1 Tax=Bradysia coprophila TaxID=38358 RepID=UPI00187D9E88|nr:RWD domain-containing protein 4 [Bradysia coprophila]